MMPVAPGRLLLAAALVALAAPACDETRSQATPLLEVDPPSGFVFPQIGPGNEEIRRVRLRNQGRGDLKVTGLKLEDRSSANEFELFYENDSGELVSVPGTLTIPQGELAVLAVRYAPVDDTDSADGGSVVLRSNDRDNRSAEIPVVTGGQGAEIALSPRTIDFGEVEAGATAVEPLTINNLGVADLTIYRIAVDDEEFGARLEGRSILGELDEPLVVPPGGKLDIEVTYSPPTQGPDTAELQFTSNDPQQPVANVTLRANGAAPCVQVVPDNVDFGAALLAASVDGPPPNVRPVSIESCGTTPLEITRIEIEGGNGAFTVVDLPDVEEGAPLFTLPPMAEGQPLPSQQLQIGFSPTELRAYGGRLLVHSNAGAPFPVDLFGRGVDNACPIPEVTTAQYDVRPLDIITLDGTPSNDPGGQVKRWEWTVVARPDGSVSQPVERFADFQRPADGGDEDDTETPTAQFFVDLAGQYVIELRVYDNLGQVSCDPFAVKQITIDAVPDKDLHVQLVWSTPADPDETDSIGTDVDLHVLHENAGGVWYADDWDVYFAQVNPEWGAPGPEDNPTLDIDDTNGAGPENVNLNRPEAGVSYEIGALYYRSESTFGLADAPRHVEHPSYVTVRIFAKGELLAEFVDRELTRVNQLWHIATVRWCEDFVRCPEIVPVDVVYDEGEYEVAARRR